MLLFLMSALTQALMDACGGIRQLIGLSNFYQNPRRTV